MDTIETKKVLKWVWVVLVVLGIFLAVETLVAFKNLRDVSPAYNTISISGEGEAFAVPDLATFSFTVSADEKTVAAAQEQVTKKVDAIVAAIKNLGIDEKDIKTTDYSAYPRYSYSQAACTPNYCPPGKQVLEGYTASHNITVKVRDTAKAGDALAVAGDNGATGLSNISFTVDDPDKITQEARALAIKEAREKAELLSDELGVRLVRVVSFSDGTDPGYPIPYGRAEMGMGGDMAVTQAKAPTLPQGENKVRVVVNVVYEIR
jgi:uncharacterized protein